MNDSFRNLCKRDLVILVGSCLLHQILLLGPGSFIALQSTLHINALVLIPCYHCKKKNPQENLATLTITSRNLTTSTQEPPICTWIRADICRHDGAIRSKNRKIVPYHRCARVLILTVSVPDYGPDSTYP